MRSTPAAIVFQTKCLMENKHQLEHVDNCTEGKHQEHEGRRMDFILKSDPINVRVYPTSGNIVYVYITES
jgi:hypothetical protein